jgi:UDP-N-acetylmuramoyl-L-alanyl-D-glutamate--2,6-diaminopimelate ligase
MQPPFVPAPGISLRELFPDATIVGAEDIRVASCCRDSRCCRGGDLFVALPGAHGDGHDYAVHALARGARAVLAARPIAGLPLPVCVVSNVEAAYGRLCHALVGDPSTRLKVVGIFGGGATTSYLTAAVLEAGGLPCGVIGSLGSFDGLDVGRESLAGTSADELAQFLARSEANGCSHAVLEAPGEALVGELLSGLVLDVAALAASARYPIVDPAPGGAAEPPLVHALKAEGVAIFNVDDPAVAALALRHEGPALTVAINNPAEIAASVVEQLVSEQTFLLTIGDTTAVVRTPLVGTGNLYNCLTAAAVGHVYGLDPTAIVGGLESLTQVPGCLERIECGQPFSIFVDHASTAAALAGAVDALRGLVRGRLITLCSGGAGRASFARAQVGRAAARSDLVIITSDNPGEEDPVEVASQVLAGIRCPQRAHIELDRAQAIEFALRQAREGDCVLIAGGAGLGNADIEEERFLFDDRDVVRDWLRRNVGPAQRRQAA